MSNCKEKAHILSPKMIPGYQLQNREKFCVIDELHVITWMDFKLKLFKKLSGPAKEKILVSPSTRKIYISMLKRI